MSFHQKEPMRVFMTLDLSQLSLSELEELICAAQTALADRQRQLPPLDAEEQALVVTRPIEAIRRYRDRAKCGLRDAKDVVDHARSELSRSRG